MKKANVYSYLRFSDPKQASGTSADRQMEYAAKWAADRGLTLDASLSLRDEGLSAYHQRHVKQGALGTFLRAVEEGRIPRGSVLVVEALDRLSRAEPILAQAQLAQIINAGITVVTASDGREYNFERLKAQPMDLVYSLLVMIRAHEESDTKSKRVKAAIRRLCEGWIAGTYRGPVGSPNNDPGWVRKTDGGKYELDHDAAKAIRLMAKMATQGYSASKIIDELNARGLHMTTGSRNSIDRVRQILAKRTLIGEKLVEIGGEVYQLAGYYPPLLTEEEFANLQHMLLQRGRRHGKGQVPALFTGMRIAFCGYCESPLVSQNAMYRNKQDSGLPQDGHRRLACTGYKYDAVCDVGGSCSVVPIERAIMLYCSDRLNLSRLMEGDGRAPDVSSQLAYARQRAADLETKIARVTEALMQDDGDAPAAILRRVREMERKLGEERGEIDSLEAELSSISTAKSPAASEAWAALIEGVELLDYDARIKARQLVADTFSKIIVYRAGFAPDEGDDGSIGVLLVSKTGGTRILRVDRKTGGFKEAEDLELVDA
jgi:DNA invertase Pin-like site-specific DNA recombinase